MRTGPRGRGRPLLYENHGRLQGKSIRLDPDTIRRLRRLGYGNLSDGIRKVAAARSWKRYHRMQEAAQEVIDAYDMDEDMGPAIDALVNALIANQRKL